MLRRRRKYLILISVLLPAICYIFFSMTGRLYAYSDNLMVAAVAGGLYGENNFCQYLHPLLCLIIKILTPLFPYTDVFTAFVHVSLIGGAILLTYIGVKSVIYSGPEKKQIEDYLKMALLFLAVVYYLIGLNVFGENYTVQTAAVIFAGMIGLFYGESESLFTTTAATVLVTIGFLIRLEAALVFFPFICLHIAVIYFDSSDKSEFAKRFRTAILPCLIIIAFLLASKIGLYSMEPYASDAEYNKYRTITEDYWMSGWDRYDPKFEGIDESTYNAAIDWILIDTDRIDTDMLKKIANAGNITSYEKSLSGVSYALQAMYRRVRYSNLHLLILTILTILLMIRNLVLLKSIWLKLESFLSVLGGFIILLYFTFLGRAPLRVWLCVLLASLSLMIIAMGIDARKKKNEKDYVFQIMMCIILYFGIGQVFAQTHFHPFQTAFTARMGADDSGYEATFEGNSLYIWPQWYDQIPEYFSQQNKLPTKRVMEHNIAMGDWTYGQTYYKEFLKTLNAENPATALLERSDIFFIEGLNEEFMKYMQDHYGNNIQMEFVRTVNGKKAYRLIRIK